MKTKDERNLNSPNSNLTMVLLTHTLDRSSHRNIQCHLVSLFEQEIVSWCLDRPLLHRHHRGVLRRRRPRRRFKHKRRTCPSIARQTRDMPTHHHEHSCQGETTRLCHHHRSVCPTMMHSMPMKMLGTVIVDLTTTSRYRIRMTTMRKYPFLQRQSRLHP